MKKLMIAAIALLGATAYAQMNIGVVDMLVLVRNHANYESNKQFLLSTEKDYQKRLDAMKEKLEEIQEEGRKLADEYRNPMLAQSAKTRLENEIMAVQQRFMEQQQRLRNEAMKTQQDLSDNEARLLKLQADDIKARIDSYAKKNGYDLVLDTSAAVYVSSAFDITDGVLLEMGVDPKNAKGRDESN